MRHKSYSILYLVIILFYLLRPLLPYIEYVLNKSFIQTNLCVERDDPGNDCHGKCYLHEQLNKQSEPWDMNTNDKRQNLPSNRIDDHLKTSPAFPRLFAKDREVSEYYFVQATARFNSFVFVPPKYQTPDFI